jgi:Domain of unknown function (DUF4386)
VLRFSDSRNFSRTLAGLGLIVGPALLVVGSLLSPASDDNTAQYLQNVADGKDAYFASAVLFLFGGYLLIPGVLGIIRLMRGRGVTFGQFAAGLVLIGVIATVAFYSFSVVEIEMAEQGNREAMVALSDAGEDAASGWVIFGLFLIGVGVGTILMAIAAWRHRVIPPWAAALLVLSPIVGFLGESVVVGALGFALLAVGLAAIGLRILSISDDAWGRWEPLEEVAAAAASEPPRPEPHPVTS